MSDELVVMRLRDMTRVHPRQVKDRVCSVCVGLRAGEDYRPAASMEEIRRESRESIPARRGGGG